MEELATNFVAKIPLFVFMQSLVLATIYAFILSYVYKKYSTVIGDKSQYLMVFPILIPTMVLIICIIKTSLALSLGLVGALSIVRFRTPIKEPEELTYLFVAISVGLGLGAGQYMITSTCFFFLIFLTLIVSRFRKIEESLGIFLDIESHDTSINSSKVKDIFVSEKIPFELRRLEENKEYYLATFYINPTNTDELGKVLNRIQDIDNNVKLTVINRVAQ